MATQFTTTVKPSGGDYTFLNSAIAGLANDLTSVTIKVFSISASTTPTIAAGDTILGQSSGATGVCVLVNASRTQILIKTIAVASFLSGEKIQKTADATINVTISNSGDSPIIGIECYAMQDTIPVIVNGYTTSITNYIHVYTPTSERHKGVWDNTKYRLEISGRAMDIYQEYTHIEGLQISGTQIAIYARFFSRISHNIIKNSGNGIYNLSYGIAWNNIIYDIIGSGFWMQSNSFAYNNTVYNCGIGFEQNSSYATLINNISYNNAFNYNATKFGVNSNFNLSGPQQTNAPGANSRNGPDMFVSFIDEVNYDLHLTKYDVGARNYGIDLSTDPNLPFSDDIDSQIRPSGSWDIGADQSSTCSAIKINFAVS